MLTCHVVNSLIDNHNDRRGTRIMDGHQSLYLPTWPRDLILPSINGGQERIGTLVLLLPLLCIYSLNDSPCGGMR